MPPVSRDAQRIQLHRTIWRIATDLRGSVDGWDFKSYVLGFLFYRFISENLTAYLNDQERQAGNPDFDYAKLSDQEAEFGRKDTVDEKGFYILPSGLFKNVRAHAASDENLNETLDRVFRSIEGSAVGADSEDDIKGLFDDLDVNSSRLGPTVAQRNLKIRKLLNAIGDLDLGDFATHEIDAFGDTYEYLMQMYAADAGKSGGEYYTPQEVAELLASITVGGKTDVTSVYDPACGSGSLLLKFQKILGPDKVRRGYFGQEINLTTYNLARINMFLHDVPYEQFHLAHGDTLLHPAHWDDEPFEAIVSNPPYSTNWEGDANLLLINDPRFAPAGVLAPKSKADMAFTMHILSWLAVNGTAAIVEFPGVLYRSGAEQKIRRYLVDNNYVDAIIQLPPDLFFGTTIATCIMVLKKSKSDNAVLFVDASAESVRPGNKNKLAEANRRRILDAIVAREDVAHFARLVPATELAENGYNLSVPAYVEKADTSEAVDITVLNAKIADIVGREDELRTEIDAIVLDLEAGPATEGGARPRQTPHATGVRWMPMGELGQFIRGRRFTKNDVVEDGIPSIHYGEIYTVYGTATTTTVSHVRRDLAGQLRYAQPGDVVIAAVGETVEDVAKAVAWLGDEPVAIHDDTFLFRSDMNPKFVSYAMQTAAFHAQKNKFVARAKVKRLGSDALAKILIPVPPMEEQERIVSILDRFQALVDALSVGLPAEVAARRHQYEHYRKKLLTFEEAAD
jgi:type I restriction enzyme M protein